MKPLTLCALIAFSIPMTACNDRETEPVVPVAPEANTMPAPMDAAPPTADLPAVAPANTGACEGLTGQALTDCLNRAGPISAPPTTSDPSTTEPSLTNPTPNDNGEPAGATAPAGAATPPQP